MKKLVLSMVFVVMCLLPIMGMATGDGYVPPITQKQSQSVDVTTVEASRIPTSPDVMPFVPPLISGTAGNYPSLPMFDHKLLTPFNYKKDKIVSVIAVYDGWMLSRICLEDLEIEMLNKANGLAEQVKGMEDNVRAIVQYKGSAWGAGFGGGGALTSVHSSGDVGTGALMPGFSTSTYNPKFIIKFVLVK